ncbi:MAG: helix-turn-helix domain-containing protein [Acidimicrobiales bacterium]
MNTKDEGRTVAYLSAIEAARQYRISVRTLTRWANAGRLPYVMEEGERWFARADLDTLVARPDDQKA